MTRHSWIVIVALLVSGSAEARSCVFQKGEARWSIKTSVPSLSETPTIVDLRSLIDLNNPTVADSQAIESTRWSGNAVLRDESNHDVTLHEGDLITTSGFLYRARCQPDGDFHLEIGPSNKRLNAVCIIVEVPDKNKIHDQSLKAKIGNVLTALLGMDSSVFSSHAKSNPIPITVTGQLFLDYTHHETDPGGGRGTLLKSGRHCAQNLWEIHPVSDLTD